MNVLFITHITGECTDGSGSVREGLCLLQSEVCHKWSQTKEARVLLVTLTYPYLSVYVQKERSRSSHRTRSRSSQKEVRRQLQSIPQTIHIPSGQGPPASPHHGRWKGPRPELPHTFRHRVLWVWYSLDSLIILIYLGLKTAHLIRISNLVKGCNSLGNVINNLAILNWGKACHEKFISGAILKWNQGGHSRETSL